eukprot:642118-Rhodomonas_salina.2
MIDCALKIINSVEKAKLACLEKNAEDAQTLYAAIIREGTGFAAVQGAQQLGGPRALLGCHLGVAA